MSSSSQPDLSAGNNDLQAAIAINHLLSDNHLAPEQTIERLSDISLQIQQAVARLWEQVQPDAQTASLLTLTQIEELVFWRPKQNQAPLTIEQAIRQQKLTSAADIGAALKAGTGCGSCVPELKKLVEKLAPAS